MQRQLSLLDRLILQADQALRTLNPKSQQALRANPSKGLDTVELSEQDRRHVAGLMRINHTGEVCAQALYQGQALTAKLDDIRQAMEQAAEEEIDHLVWCEQRLNELDSHTSFLNPAFYAISFVIGATAGLISDRISLGFVAATEERVCDHLRDHLAQLPVEDLGSQAILETMLDDEQKHGTMALEAGGMPFPGIVKAAMSQSATLMTKTTYYL